MCNKEKFWPALCQAIERPQWAAEPDFANFKARLANRERLTQALDEALSARTTGEWMKIFAGKVPAAPVYDVAQALQNGFVAERGGLADYAYADGRKARMVAPPIRVPGVEPPARAAPAMGEHTESELRAAGYSGERIAALRKAGAIK